MSNILVTGGAGFIGSNLVDKLIEEGHSVIIIDNLISGKKEYINPKADWKELSITSNKVEDIFKNSNFDYVFHLAAQIDVRKSVENPELDNSVNVIGGLNILKNCHKYKVKKILFSSTGGAIYGDTEEIPTTEKCDPLPISPYGINKLAFEKYLNYYYKVFGQKYTSLRFSNVYGVRQFKGGEAGVIAIFINNAVLGEQSNIFGDGTQTRDFVYVSDIVKALIKAMNSEYVGEVNISSGTEINLLDLVKEINNNIDGEMDVVLADAKVGEQKRSCLDNSQAKEVLGWEPTVGIEEGVKKTIEWSKNNI